MSYAEFPGTNFYESDLRELIELYKKLTDDYSGTLQQINNVNDRLSEYERNMNSQIENITNVIVPAAVEVAVTNQLSTSLGEINQEISNLKINYNHLNQLLQEEVHKLNQKDTVLEELISELQHNTEQQYMDVISQMNGMVRSLEYKITAMGLRIDQTRLDLESEIDTRIEDTTKDLTKKIDNESIILQQKIDDTRMQLLIDMQTAIEIHEKKNELEFDNIYKIISDMQESSNMNAIRWLWQYGTCFGGYDAITWYRDSWITAEEWSKRDFDCVDWYIRGREIFKWFDRLHFMISPITGRTIPVQEVIQELCLSLSINGITAGEYEQLHITAEEYDNLKIPDNIYDWAGRSVLCSAKKQNI